MSEIERQSVDRKIKSQKQLAENLGFKPEENSKSTTLRRYTKDIQTSDGKQAELVFTVESVSYLALKKPYQGERYYLSVRIHESDDWGRKIKPQILNKALTEGECVDEDPLHFIKKSLKQFGYNQLYETLKPTLDREGEPALEANRLAEELYEEYEAGDGFIRESLLPNTLEKYPDAKFDNQYGKGKEKGLGRSVYMYLDDKKSKITKKVIEFRITGSDSFEISVGRSKVSEEGRVNPNLSGEYFIIPPDSLQEIYDPETGKGPRRSYWEFGEVGTALATTEAPVAT